MVCLKVLQLYSPGETEKHSHKHTSIKIAGNAIEIQTEQLPKTIIERWRYINLIGSYVMRHSHIQILLQE
jgi:hypothetical protein